LTIITGSTGLGTGTPISTALNPTLSAQTFVGACGSVSRIQKSGHDPADRGIIQVSPDRRRASLTKQHQKDHLQPDQHRDGQGDERWDGKVPRVADDFVVDYDVYIARLTCLRGGITLR
jgi:hypothetical protein